jgi:hypothetical protein
MSFYAKPLRCHLLAGTFACALLGAGAAAAQDADRCADQPSACEHTALALAPPTEPPAFLAGRPSYELKLDTLTGCGLIDSASIGPGASVFGLRVGRDSLEQVRAKLEQQGAKFKSDLGYRGYREDLPIAAVQSLPAAQPIGAPTQMWLRFNSLGVLYRVTLVLEGKSALADVHALLAKASPRLAAACPSARAECSVDQDGVALTLGTRSDQIALSIASTPLDEEARNTEKLIDADIRRKRLGAARND